MTTTTTISVISRTDAKVIDAEVEVALTAIAEKHGLAYSQKDGSFSASIMRVSGEFGVADAKRNAFNLVIRRLIDENRQPYFTENDFGRTFSTGGHTFTITGANPRAPKYAIEANREDGSPFKFPARTVRACLDLETLNHAGKA